MAVVWSDLASPHSLDAEASSPRALVTVICDKEEPGKRTIRVGQPLPDDRSTPREGDVVRAGEPGDPTARRGRSGDDQETTDVADLPRSVLDDDTGESCLSVEAVERGLRIGDR
jgi:hypothetical protein